MVQTPVPKAAPGNYNSIAAQYARAKAIKDAEDKAKAEEIMQENGLGLDGKELKKSVVERLNERKGGRWMREWGWVVGFFVWLL
jgi:phosphatidylinositol glycan class O